MPLDPIVSPYAAFASALLDPERGMPAVVGPNGKAAGKRYDVYRNNVTVSLIESLAAIYPAVQRITGADFFRAMARFHIRATPPTSPLLSEYGREFPAFIQAYEYAQTLAWLADVARIERGWLDAYHASDAAPLSAETLAAIPPERLGGATLAVHPATRIVRSQYSAVTIFAANRCEGPIGQINAETAEDALITRPNTEVIVRHLPEGGAEFLLSLMSGRTFGEAAASALEASPRFDIAANIAGMIEAGAFTTVNSGDEHDH